MSVLTFKLVHWKLVVDYPDKPPGANPADVNFPGAKGQSRLTTS